MIDLSNLRADLNQLIETLLLSLIVGDPAHICIIDAPGHPNVGDEAILLGELDFIAKCFAKARVTFWDVDNYSPKADRFIEEANVLLIHGGGNFGDLYPDHHGLRMRILDRFQHKQIIQLPQSISFSNETAIAETARSIKAQNNFTLIVRDQKSYQWAKQHFECAVALSPDMAFAMNPIHRSPASADCFCLLRTDSEKVADHDSILQIIHSTGRTVETGDWLKEPKTPTLRSDQLLRMATKRAPALLSSLQDGAVRLRRRYATQRVKTGIEILSAGRVVVADRLHAHILCCLLDIPHVAFDSFDGKISAFYESWTKERAPVRLAHSPADLVRLLTELESA